MSAIGQAEIQRVPSGRHIVALVGDPGPVPGEDDTTPLPQSGAPAPAGLRSERMNFWSQQVALHGYELSCTDYADITRRRTARRIAVDQFQAASRA